MASSTSRLPGERVGRTAPRNGSRGCRGHYWAPDCIRDEFNAHRRQNPQSMQPYGNRTQSVRSVGTGENRVIRDLHCPSPLAIGGRRGVAVFPAVVVPAVCPPIGPDRRGA